LKEQSTESNVDLLMAPVLPAAAVSGNAEENMDM
jgi:hypothetical protein